LKTRARKSEFFTIIPVSIPGSVPGIPAFRVRLRKSLREGALASSLLEGGNLDGRSAGALSDAFAAYTGQNCFVTQTS
jgi:hypothetical protein